MPEISVTDEQEAKLEEVRADVEEAYVETYGHARLGDAIQYLLDTYTPPSERETAGAYDRIATAEYPELQRVASEVPEVPGSGIDADEMRGKLLATLGAEQFAAKLDVATKEDGSEDDTKPTPVERETDDGNKADSTAAAPADGTGDGSGDPEGSGPLATANRLLRENSDKWRESDRDAPYEVELPDGTTEPARTKDDVRQLLFRHY